MISVIRRDVSLTDIGIVTASRDRRKRFGWRQGSSGGGRRTMADTRKARCCPAEM